MDYNKLYEGKELTETQKELKALLIERQAVEKRKEYLFKLGADLIKEGHKELGHETIMEANTLQTKWGILDRAVGIKNMEDDLENYEKMLNAPADIPYASNFNEQEYELLKQQLKEYKEGLKKLEKEYLGKEGK